MSKFEERKHCLMGYVMGLAMMFMAFAQYERFSQLSIFEPQNPLCNSNVESNVSHKFICASAKNDMKMPSNKNSGELAPKSNTFRDSMAKQIIIQKMLNLTHENVSNKVILLMQSKNEQFIPESTTLDPNICFNIPKSTACASAVAWSYQRILGNGCAKLFLDVGSNIGIHGRFLFEPELYQPRHLYDNIFDSEFGGNRTQNREEMCVVAFEPNPRHRKRQQEVATAYARQGWRYRAFYAAVGGSTWQSSFHNTIGFYLNDNSRSNDWGFSIKNVHGGNTKKVEVPILDLSRFVLEHIGRTAVRPRRVLMKMDIEGSEFSVLPYMLATSSFNYIDALTIEFHLWPNGFSFQLGQLHMSQTDCKEFSRVFPLMLKAHYNTTFQTVDDESFLFDGKPLPP
mmetsp:Transcript_45039/g.72494  ORF Transcript_45039/g.72494 Transcript_45039/m.72494 type:complete len:398 (+) Transcript_45039:279-1472(+)|eukprot:CAMPEP_0179428810 /NCGR_PEP_ID=MMETSP0799-20121207/14378_1 /TAXON_ID=46947 /ORGANISM="Geminigera cryophila, Strain CCMP2564" /LENGTH=397 /DNA_ID=CAMNT_0021204469 /DNA_START=345 /DNA_END=1538 /DNA_ORIENTATION=+